MLRRLVAIAAWACLTFIAYATLSPIDARPTLARSAAFEHVAAFSLLGVFFALLIRDYRFSSSRLC